MEEVVQEAAGLKETRQEKTRIFQKRTGEIETF